VLDDRDLRLGRMLSRGPDRPALRSAARIVECVQVGRVPEHRRTEADPDPRLVHHVEHSREAAPRLADEIADRPGATLRLELAFAEIEQAVAGAAVTHLVVEAGERHVIAFTDDCARIRTVAGNAHQELRHDE